MHVRRPSWPQPGAEPQHRAASSVPCKAAASICRRPQALPTVTCTAAGSRCLNPEPHTLQPGAQSSTAHSHPAGHLTPPACREALGGRATGQCLGRHRHREAKKGACSECISRALGASVVLSSLTMPGSQPCLACQPTHPGCGVSLHICPL